MQGKTTKGCASRRFGRLGVSDAIPDSTEWCQSCKQNKTKKTNCPPSRGCLSSQFVSLMRQFIGIDLFGASSMELPAASGQSVFAAATLQLFSCTPLSCVRWYPNTDGMGLCISYGYWHQYCSAHYCVLTARWFFEFHLLDRHSSSSDLISNFQISFHFVIISSNLDLETTWVIRKLILNCVILLGCKTIFRIFVLESGLPPFSMEQVSEQGQEVAIWLL